MPEGFNSLAEMQVVVDSSTEKFTAGMAAARGVVEKFAGDGSKQLAFFDSNVQKLGVGVDFLRSRLMVWIQVAQIATSVIGKIAEYGDKAGQWFGKTEDWEEIKNAAKDMAAALGDGLGGVYDQAKRATTSYNASQDASVKLTEKQTGALRDMEPVQGAVAKQTDTATEATERQAEATDKLATSMAKGTAEVQGYGERLKTGLVDALGQVAHGFRTIGDPSIWRSNELKREIDGIGSTLNMLQKSIQDTMRDAKSAPLLSDWIGLGNIDRDMENMGLMIARAQELGYNLKVALQRENEQRISDEGASAQKIIDKFTASTEKEITALERKVEMLGMAKDEAAAYAVVMRLVDELTAKGATLTGEQAEKIAELANRFRDATRAMIGFERSQAGTRELDAIKDKTRDLQVRLETLGLDKAIAAEMVQRSQLEAKLAAGRIAMSDDQRRAALDELSAQRRITEEINAREAAVKRADQLRRVLDGGDKESQAITARTRAIYGMTDAVAAQAAEERMLLQLRHHGITATDLEIAAIRAKAREIGELTARYEEQQQMSRIFADVSATTSRAAADAFKRYRTDVEFDMKALQELLRKYLEQLREMLIQKLVFDQITKAVTGGIGSIAGSLGGGGSYNVPSTWGTTTVTPAGLSFGGFRASGGRALPDEAYIVGERGPEWFVPDTAGAVVPMMRASAPSPSAALAQPVVNVNITAPPGTTAAETGRRQSGSGMSIDIMIEQIEGAIAQRVNDGSSALGHAMQSTFGLSNAAGAR